MKKNSHTKLWLAYYQGQTQEGEQQHSHTSLWLCTSDAMSFLSSPVHQHSSCWEVHCVLRAPSSPAGWYRAGALPFMQLQSQEVSTAAVHSSPSSSKLRSRRRKEWVATAYTSSPPDLHESRGWALPLFPWCWTEGQKGARLEERKTAAALNPRLQSHEKAGSMARPPHQPADEFSSPSALASWPAGCSHTHFGCVMHA